MCGITGWIDWEKDLSYKRPIVESMAETLSFRGPDDGGIWLSSQAALAHRRLIVIDPEGGIQPMTRWRGEDLYAIVYNGEIYNTNELRLELKTCGYNFFGHSDTEVLLTAFMEWGTECLKRLNGIFAFAVWDESRQRLLLARDRLGVKPLFYARRGCAFLFGSELKSILAHPLIQPELDAEGLAEVFLIGPAHTPGHGIFHGIDELKPGHWLIYDRKGLRTKQYWTLKSENCTDELQTTAVKVRHLLEDAVKRQLVSDVPICVMLSGGLDSSAITAFAVKELEQTGHEQLTTYSIDYIDNDFNYRPNIFQPSADAPYAQKVSSLFGTLHQNVLIDTPELIDALTIAMRARDLPGMVDVDASLYLFSREVKKGATVALSGECADEIFGGYPWCQNRDILKSKVFPWMRMVHERMSLFSPELLKFIRPEEYMEQRYSEALKEVPCLPEESQFETEMRQLLYLNITRWMPVLLDRMDRMSMAAGLEVRVPFCDHNLVEYVWNIPWAIKNYDQREKGILRRALSGLLPNDILMRRKSPYPKTHNPAYLKATRNWLLDILNNPNSPLLQFVDKDAVIELINTNAADFEPAWFGQLMSGAQLFAYLIQIDIWLREYHVFINFN